MEITLKIELGQNTLNFISGLAAGTVIPAPKAAATKVEVAEKPAATPAPKAPAEKASAPAKPKANAFEDLDEDAKLEAIKTEVTRHTKKGKSADIKTLLTHFGAARASELDAEKYGEFYDAIVRYGKGEAIADIAGGEDDLA